MLHRPKALAYGCNVRWSHYIREKNVTVFIFSIVSFLFSNLAHQQAALLL